MNRKGQALIEFIIILPIFIMLMLAVFDVVKIYNEKSKMESFVEDLVLDSSLDIEGDYFIDSNVSDGKITYKVSKKLDLNSPVLSVILGNPYEITTERVVYE